MNAHVPPKSKEPPTLIFDPAADGEWLSPVGRRWLDPRPGQVLGGGCEVIGLLGQGGLSRVYRVHRHDWGLDMALKLPQAATLDRLAAETFVREASDWLLPARHPHVAACHYVVKLMGRPAIFMEYVEGRSLAALMEEGRASLYEGDPAGFLDLMIQAARGLKYVHSLGLRNLDIKPANLLLDKDGRLLLADFAPLSLAGTHQYFSPEAAEGRGEGVFPDLWALALSGLECFLGRRPWEAGSVAGYGLDSYLGGGWGLAPPPVLVDFFRKALAAEVSGRYPGAAEMEAALTAIYVCLTGKEYPRRSVGPLPESFDRLNNKAVSFLELERPAEAGRLWAEALEIEPARRGASLASLKLARVASVKWAF